MPRIEVTKIKVYKYNELSQRSQEYAAKEYQEKIQVDDYWSDTIIEDVTEIGKIIGIEIDKIYWSGFHSQGDGACFEGKYYYEKGSVKNIKQHCPKDTVLNQIAKDLQIIQAKNFYKLNATVKHSGHYYHENSTNISVYNSWEDTNITNEEEISKILRRFMKWIYQQFYKEYTYISSEECFLNDIESNNFEFTESGKFYFGFDYKNHTFEDQLEYIFSPLNSIIENARNLCKANNVDFKPLLQKYLINQI